MQQVESFRLTRIVDILLSPSNGFRDENPIAEDRTGDKGRLSLEVAVYRLFFRLTRVVSTFFGKYPFLFCLLPPFCPSPVHRDPLLSILSS